MIKTIDFAGIELDNYTVREMIMNVEKDMSDHGFHTIEAVSYTHLLKKKYSKDKTKWTQTGLDWESIHGAGIDFASVLHPPASTLHKFR